MIIVWSCRYSLRLTPLGESSHHSRASLNSNKNTEDTETDTAAAAMTTATVAATDSANKTIAVAVEKVVVTAEGAVNAADKTDAQKKQVKALIQELAVTSEGLELWHRSRAKSMLARVEDLLSLASSSPASSVVHAIENTDSTTEGVVDNPTANTDHTNEVSAPPHLTIEKKVEVEYPKERMSVMRADAEVKTSPF